MCIYTGLNSELLIHPILLSSVEAISNCVITPHTCYSVSVWCTPWCSIDENIVTTRQFAGQSVDALTHAQRQREREHERAHNNRIVRIQHKHSTQYR